MEAEKLFKKGQASKTEDGSLVLVNEDQTAYKVNEIVLMIWDMCNGVSFNELAKEITAHAEQDVASVRTSLEELFVQLQEHKLVEIQQP